jgi:hypothetical protein
MNKKAVSRFIDDFLLHGERKWVEDI